jgi:hypothetical protein
LETLSTFEFTKNDFKIHPNPVTNNLYFSSSDFTEAQILITDFSGKVVLHKALQLEEGLDVSNLTSGIYTITVNQSSNYRFVKM